MLDLVWRKQLDPFYTPSPNAMRLQNPSINHSFNKHPLSAYGAAF